MAIKKRLGSLLGPQGAPGPPGERGLPGPDAIPADEAVAAYIEDKDTNTRRQLGSVISASTETDYVDMLRKMSYYDEISLIKTHDGGMQQFDVYLKNADITQKITFTKPDDYFKMSGIRIASTGFVSVNQNVSVTDLTYAGDWSINEPRHNRYARNTGDTATYTVDTTGTINIMFRHFADNRGGIFRATLNDSQPVDVSTYSNTAVLKTTHLYTDLPPGSYTLQLEFIGDDPNNAPEGGISRGWLLSETLNDQPIAVFEITGEEATEGGEQLLMSDTSNKEFAFSIAPVDGTNFQWIPQHTTATTVKRSEPIFMLDGVQHHISDFNIGQEYSCQDFKFIQDVYGRNPDSGTTNLVNVKTIHSITRDGNINISGSMNFLEDTQVGSSYVIMAPVNNGLFDVLQTGWGSKYATTKTDGTSTTLAEGADCGNYLYLAEDQDYYVAFRHTDKRGNFDHSGQAQNSYHNFINHRDATIVKHYINIFDNQTLPAGYKYRWSGDYITGKLNGVHDLMSS